MVSAYRVYDWDWRYNCRGVILTYYDVTLLGLAARPGEILHLPSSGCSIGGGYNALVLYASEQRITLSTRGRTMSCGDTRCTSRACKLNLAYWPSIAPECRRTWSPPRASDGASLWPGARFVRVCGHPRFGDLFGPLLAQGLLVDMLAVHVSRTVYGAQRGAC